jgi:hypothetical protein
MKLALQYSGLIPFFSPFTIHTLPHKPQELLSSSFFFSLLPSLIPVWLPTLSAGKQIAISSFLFCLSYSSLSQSNIN